MTVNSKMHRMDESENFLSLISVPALQVDCSGKIVSWNQLLPSLFDDVEIGMEVNSFTGCSICGADLNSKSPESCGLLHCHKKTISWSKVPVQSGGALVFFKEEEPIAPWRLEMEKVPCPVLVTDRQNLILWHNKAFGNLFPDTGVSSYYETGQFFVKPDSDSEFRFQSLPHQLFKVKAEQLDSGGFLYSFFEDTALKIAADEIHRMHSENKNLINFSRAFLAEMSHEIKNPLQDILNLTRLLESEGTATGNSSDAVKLIKDCSDSILSVVNDALDMDRIDAGKFTLNEKTFDFNDFLRTKGGIACMQARIKGLSFELELSPDLPRFVSADAQRIGQVLRNLFSNAIKNTKSGSVIFRVHKESDSQDFHMIRFSVADTGCGIAPEYHSHIFLPRFQLGSMNQKIKGHGFGLAISKKLVEHMHGTLEVMSQENTGSEFYFTIPVKKHTLSQAEMGQYVSDSKSSLRPQRVLLIDDNRLNCILVQKLLEKDGHKVVFANDAETGSELLAVELFDFVLLDINLPGMNGLQLLKKIKEKEIRLFDPEIPVIALTGISSSQEKDTLMGQGFDDVIFKPVNPAEIMQILAMHKYERFYRETSFAVPMGDSHQFYDELRISLRNNWELMFQLFNLYLADMPPLLDELKSYAGNHDGLVRIVHSIRNLSGVLRIRTLMELSAEIESELKEESPLPAIMLKKLEDSVVASLGMIRQLLNTRHELKNRE